MTNAPFGSLPLLGLLLLGACSGGKDRSSEIRFPDDKVVGVDGVFGSTYYVRQLDLAVTVPPAWTISALGKIMERNWSGGGAGLGCASCGGRPG
jgi:hypothetical protein